jgi:hypothetical protein
MCNNKLKKPKIPGKKLRKITKVRSVKGAVAKIGRIVK